MGNKKTKPIFIKSVCDFFINKFDFYVDYAINHKKTLLIKLIWSNTIIFGRIGLFY